VYVDFVIGVFGGMFGMVEVLVVGV